MAATTLMSFADFERLENGAEKIELLKGELIRVPPAQNPHMDFCERLFELLKAEVARLLQTSRESPVGRVHMERGYRMSEDPPSWLQPDVSITHPGQAGERYYSGSPLIAFEVASESDTAPRLNAKTAEYLANGASEVWIFYPEQREAWVYDRGGTARREAEAVRSPALPGIEVRFSSLFEPTEPASPAGAK